MPKTEPSIVQIADALLEILHDCVEIFESELNRRCPQFSAEQVARGLRNLENTGRAIHCYRGDPIWWAISCTGVGVPAYP